MGNNKQIRLAPYVERTAKKRHPFPFSVNLYHIVTEAVIKDLLDIKQRKKAYNSQPQTT